MTFLGRLTLALLTPLLYAGRLLIRVYLRFFCDRRVSTKAKCPGCGIRKKHEIKWVPQLEKELHECGQCHAVWGDDPVLPIERWRVGLEPEEEGQEDGKIRRIS